MDPFRNSLTRRALIASGAAAAVLPMVAKPSFSAGTPSVRVRVSKWPASKVSESWIKAKRGEAGLLSFKLLTSENEIISIEEIRVSTPTSNGYSRLEI